MITEIPKIRFVYAKHNERHLKLSDGKAHIEEPYYLHVKLQCAVGNDDEGNVVWEDIKLEKEDV